MRILYEGIPASGVLLAWSMRGHHAPPDPTRCTEEDIRRYAEFRARPGPTKRWMTPALATIVSEVIRRHAERRRARLVAMLLGRTCVYARLDLHGFDDPAVFSQAVNLIATRRARRELGWPRDERVFGRRPHVRTLPPLDPQPLALLDRASLTLL